ncbi:hypothetical protein [Aeromicrobium sp. Leaf350]|uniref:hypothetical protein n=1 Tax=Aeromicrobium sp. Leaf350 TaxID=2876565 RepID=UPI001E3B6E3D|nr:hypothetical protein [Aeromicrobium sp. Leaf350]
MQYLVFAAIAVGLGLLAPRIERTLRAQFGDDDGDGETGFLLAFFGGIVGLFVLFLLGAGIWYLAFER